CQVRGGPQREIGLCVANEQPPSRKVQQARNEQTRDSGAKDRGRLCAVERPDSDREIAREPGSFASPSPPSAPRAPACAAAGLVLLPPAQLRPPPPAGPFRPPRAAGTARETLAGPRSARSLSPRPTPPRPPHKSAAAAAAGATASPNVPRTSPAMKILASACLGSPTVGALPGAQSDHAFVAGSDQAQKPGLSSLLGHKVTAASVDSLAASNRSLAAAAESGVAGSAADLSAFPPRVYKASGSTASLQAGNVTAQSATFFTPYSSSTTTSSSVGEVVSHAPAAAAAAPGPASVGVAGDPAQRPARSLLSSFGIGPPKVKAKTFPPVTTAASVEQRVAESAGAGSAVPLRPAELADLMVLPGSDSPSAKKPPQLIDLRPLDQFQAEHLIGSVNVNLPTLLVKRYRRGSMNNFNLESFITTNEGKEVHRKRVVSDVVVVYDDAMDQRKDDEPSWALLGVLSRDVAQGKIKLCWLVGGYQAFKEWDTTGAYRITAEPSNTGRERSGTM
ncbi:MAG: hypothetical protein BJ554DRAFT_5058, partial [Olpidium bornovanus]